MSRLRIKNFSCIEEADIEIANLTLLIGPQASGKSVIAKLIYFFKEIFANQEYYYNLNSSLDTLKEKIVKEFSELFPPSAWGNKIFSLNFEHKEFFIVLERKSSKTNNLSIIFSKEFSETYNLILDFFKQYITQSSPITAHLDRQAIIEASFQRKTKESIAGGAFFIPAGRSFFTTLSKGLDVFNNLDSVTRDFGKIFVRTLENSIANQYKLFQTSYQKQFRDNILGGEIKRDKNGGNYLTTADGRNIPFAFLSSGQQELLPLWLVLEDLYAFNQVKKNGSELLLFIEEPEAHLFPSAQAKLTEYIASLTGEDKNGNTNKIFITTHSPYILAQVNNLLEAGIIAEKLGKASHKKIAKIIPKEAWLMPGEVAAFAIDNGKVVSIIGEEDGLIDASYIDAISGEISTQFDALLEIGYSHAKK